MKCEICGRETSLAPCSVCGARICSICGAGLCGDNAGRAYLCPTHYKDVVAYIESLKPKEPKWTVRYVDAHYWVDRDYDGYEGRSFFIDESAADALYNYMRGERGNS